MHLKWRLCLCRNYLETFSSTGLLGIRFCAANFCVRSLTVPSLLSCRTTRRSPSSSVWLFSSYSTSSLGLLPYHGFFSSESSLFAAFIKGVKSFLLFVLDNLFEGESAFLSYEVPFVYRRLFDANWPLIAHTIENTYYNIRMASPCTSNFEKKMRAFIYNKNSNMFH